MYFHDCYTKLPVQVPQAICIGKFDGVHLGHQALIKATNLAAKLHGVIASAVCFHPHPMEYFAQKKISNLTNLKERNKLLLHYGLDRVYCFEFNKKLAELSAQDFLEEVLYKTMCAKVIVVGEDFRFGAKRQGDIKLMQKWAQQHNLKVVIISDQQYKQKRISTSWCRELYASGDVAMLGMLIGRQNLII